MGKLSGTGGQKFSSAEPLMSHPRNFHPILRLALIILILEGHILDRPLVQIPEQSGSTSAEYHSGGPNRHNPNAPIHNQTSGSIRLATGGNFFLVALRNPAHLVNDGVLI